MATVLTCSHGSSHPLVAEDAEKELAFGGREDVGKVRRGVTFS